MKTYKNYFVPSLYQKYIVPGLPFTALDEPMLTYMKSYAEIGDGRTISAMPATNDKNTAAWTENKWYSVIQVCEFLGINRSTFYKWRALSLAPQVVRLPNGDLRVREDWLANFLSGLPSEFER
jgi:predicted DNA-binding transcriptional regulator AlpA